MLEIVKIDPHGDEARALIRQLDAYLNGQYEAQAHYSTHNLLSADTTFFAARLDGEPVGCGAFRPMADANAVEIKRMYVAPNARRQGVARAVLAALEGEALRTGFTIARLETGIKQVEAIPLYRSAGYELIDCYPPYAGMAESLCFEKVLA